MKHIGLTIFVRAMKNAIEVLNKFLPPAVHYHSHKVIETVGVGGVTGGIKEPQLQREDHAIGQFGVAMQLVHILKAL